MRGTLLRRGDGAAGHGIIPAYAGNTFFAAAERVETSGSSPRMRGTRFMMCFPWFSNGIIPAYAGNTRPGTVRCRCAGDHPRVCGEHVLLILLSPFVLGSSPRMRGTHQMQGEHLTTVGIIPAYAGNTLFPCGTVRSARDHPRVCGEHAVFDESAVDAEGSSPRMRGTLWPTPPTRAPTGIIPAYAGNTFRSIVRTGCWRDHPRVCGEHPHEQ